jgi:transcriptional regulator with XRE-family HTH domain
VAEAQDWAHLASAVRARRDELGLTQEQVAAAGGPSTATMRLIESALAQSYRQRTFRQLEEALGWERGTCRRVLAGGEPTPASATGTSFAIPETVRVASEMAADIGALVSGRFADELPEDADRLTRRQRDAVLSVVTAMLDSPAAQTEGRAITKPLRAVARKRPADMPRTDDD